MNKLLTFLYYSTLVGLCFVKGFGLLSSSVFSYGACIGLLGFAGLQFLYGYAKKNQRAYLPAAGAICLALLINMSKLNPIYFISAAIITAAFHISVYYCTEFYNRRRELPTLPSHNTAYYGSNRQRSFEYIYSGDERVYESGNTPEASPR